MFFLWPHSITTRSQRPTTEEKKHSGDASHHCTTYSMMWHYHCFSSKISFSRLFFWFYFIRSETWMYFSRLVLLCVCGWHSCVSMNQIWNNQINSKGLSKSQKGTIAILWMYTKQQLPQRKWREIDWEAGGACRGERLGEKHHKTCKKSMNFFRFKF